MSQCAGTFTPIQVSCNILKANFVFESNFLDKALKSQRRTNVLGQKLQKIEREKKTGKSKT